MDSRHKQDVVHGGLMTPTVRIAQAMPNRLPRHDFLPRSSRIAKRWLDICGAGIGMLILLLLLPWILLLVFCEDRGPIFYYQQRVGLHGRSFRAFKLRSMCKDADRYLIRHPELLTVWLAQGKLRDDPRVTRTGRFLRRTSLDELPQMFNILRGEMSLVGPRAIQSSECAAFGELGELRLLTKPGLTGLWHLHPHCSQHKTKQEQEEHRF